MTAHVFQLSRNPHGIPMGGNLVFPTGFPKTKLPLQKGFFFKSPTCAIPHLVWESPLTRHTSRRREGEVFLPPRLQLLDLHILQAIRHIATFVGSRKPVCLLVQLPRDVVGKQSPNLAFLSMKNDISAPR